jgi:predicted nucleic acid-binding protein
VKSTLIDAGPLIALFSRNDKHHDRILNFLKEYKGYLVSTWLVITETCHMLDFDVRAQIAFLEWLNRGAVEIFEIKPHAIESIIKLTKKYSDIPMDLADASLVLASTSLGIKEIITIDSDFCVYRTTAKEMIKNVFTNSDKA